MKSPMRWLNTKRKTAMNETLTLIKDNTEAQKN